MLLDTDHLSVFTDERDPRHELLNSRMEAATEQVACTIVNVEEVLRGCSAGAALSISFNKMTDSPVRILFRRLAETGPLAISDGKMSGARSS